MRNSIQRQKTVPIKCGQPNDALVDQMDIKSSEDRSWFQEFWSAIVSSPDLDYSQFTQIESKKTRHQMEIGRWY